MEHILKGPYRVLIFIKRAAADPGQLNRLVHGFRLAGVQQAAGLHHLAEDLRQRIRVHNIIVRCLRHGSASVLML